MNAKKILLELKEKSKLVLWHKEKREEYYMLFAKSFKKKSGRKMFIVLI